MPKDQLFYIGQKAFITNGDKLLILIDPKWGLDLPGGKVQKGEKNLNKAFLRELKEEIGLKVEKKSPLFTWIWDQAYPYPILLVGYGCKYISGEIKLSKEHSEFYWVSKKDYRKVLKKYWKKNLNLCKTIDLYFRD